MNLHTIKAEATIPVTPQVLAEAFANFDNEEMLAFFEHVTSVFKRDCKRGHFALMDQFIWVANQDTSQDTLTCLSCLVRDSEWHIRNRSAP